MSNEAHAQGRPPASATEATGAPEAPKLVIQGASMQYRGPSGTVTALRDVSLTLGHGEFISIVGPSGCGKSTLLRLASGLEEPSHGRILLDGVELAGIPPKVGFMFQRDTLMPWARVDDNIAVGLELGGAPAEQRSARLAELIGFLGLDGFEKHYPATLSGGMRQRVSLGRLLAYEPELYLMDEPFGALDAQTKMTMGRELLRIWSTYRKSVIFVTHDIEEAVSLSDRVVVMSGRPGHIKAEHIVNLPRPRDFRGTRLLPEFRELCETIWDQIIGSASGAPAAAAERFGA